MRHEGHESSCDEVCPTVSHASKNLAIFEVDPHSFFCTPQPHNLLLLFLRPDGHALDEFRLAGAVGRGGRFIHKGIKYSVNKFVHICIPKVP